MDFLIWLWILYIIGSFILSIFVRIRAVEKRKIDNQTREEDETQKSIKEELSQNQKKQRNAVIQKNNQRAQQLRANHREKSSPKEKIKETSLEELKQTLVNITATKNQALTEEYFTSKDNEVNQMSSEGFADSDEYFEDVLDVVEQQLDDLDEWYSDQAIEDVSWMGLEDSEILLERKTVASSAQAHTNPIQQILSDKQTLRNHIIFHEIMSKPKSLRKNDR